MGRNMKSFSTSLLILGIAVSMAACSSKQTQSDVDSPDAIPPAADAATDAIPEATPEQAATDPNAAPPAEDPNAAAAAQPTTNAAVDPAPAPASDPMASSGTGGGGGMEDYTVQRGDTLMKIAFDTYGDLYRWKDIYEANRDKIQSPTAIPAGTVLKIEKPSSPVVIDRNGERYMIKTGDTLGKISHNVYGTPRKWRKLWENNKQLIRDPNKIYAGFYLYYTLDGDSPRQNETAPQPMANSGAPATDTPRTPAAADAAPAAAAQPAPAALDAPPQPSGG